MSNNQNNKLPPIDCGEDDFTRFYIPLAGGYKFQTKGKGSTVRLLCPDGAHVPVYFDKTGQRCAAEDTITPEERAAFLYREPMGEK